MDDISSKLRRRFMASLGIVVLPLFACNGGKQGHGNAHPPPPGQGRAVCGPPGQQAPGHTPGQQLSPPAAPPFQDCASLRTMHSCGAMIDAPFMPRATAHARHRQNAGVCCYDISEGDNWCRNMPPNAGRALRPWFAAPPLVASTVLRKDWRDGASGGALADSQRWLDDAAAEHASVAAFASLSLALLSHGAPLDLVRDAHEAARDERTSVSGRNRGWDGGRLSGLYGDLPRARGCERDGYLASGDAVIGRWPLFRCRNSFAQHFMIGIETGRLGIFDNLVRD